METIVLGMKEESHLHYLRPLSSNIQSGYSICPPLLALTLAQLTVSCQIYGPAEIPAYPEHRRCTDAQVHYTGLRTVPLQFVSWVMPEKVWLGREKSTTRLVRSISNGRNTRTTFVCMFSVCVTNGEHTHTRGAPKLSFTAKRHDHSAPPQERARLASRRKERILLTQ
jgi:hypothetical protein